LCLTERIVPHRVCCASVSVLCLGECVVPHRVCCTSPSVLCLSECFTHVYSYMVQNWFKIQDLLFHFVLLIHVNYNPSSKVSCVRYWNGIFIVTRVELCTLSFSCDFSDTLCCILKSSFFRTSVWIYCFPRDSLVSIFPFSVEQFLKILGGETPSL
jgi:hypothetical protein